MGTICAAVFFLWQGRTWRELAAYWVAGVLGFLAGQAAGALSGWRVLSIGQVDLLWGIGLALAALVLVRVARV
ncbi:MAG: hypothetical protein H5T60_14160 [Anaerolineae bacterium]|nr:hypothetical protein [Anaerolineae bacterium]